MVPWLIGGVVLLVLGLVLRRVLGMHTRAKSRDGRPVPLSPELEALYLPVAQEIDAHFAILGITLGDAFAQREANQPEMAWQIVHLAMLEWDRMAGFVVGLQNTLSKFLPNTEVVVPVRPVSADNFKSRPVIGYVGLYEFLDRLVFSSKRRFALQLRVLSRTSILVSKEFRRVCVEGARSRDVSPEVWNRLDLYFHDFDLITKESLLAFRALLACQSPEGVRALSLDLHVLLSQGVRVSIPVIDQ